MATRIANHIVSPTKINNLNRTNDLNACDTHYLCKDEGI